MLGALSQRWPGPKSSRYRMSVRRPVSGSGRQCHFCLPANHEFRDQVREHWSTSSPTRRQDQLQRSEEGSRLRGPAVDERV